MKKTGIWLVHVGYWALFGLLLLTFFFFAVYVPAHVRPGPLQNNGLIAWLRLMTGFALLPGLLSFYLFYTYLFDRFLGRKQFMAFLLAGWLTAFLSAWAGAALASTPLLFGPAFLFGDGYHSAMVILLLMTTIAWINGVIAAVIKGCLTWYRDIRLKEELYRKNEETELALIKSRIDPHFLFNTLNNIDTLIGREPETASAYLNKLSGIMRFLLYETKDERIGLDRELGYLQQYIDLQKIRTSNPDYVNLYVAGQLSGAAIAPMLLLPFIENAFKHTETHKAGSRISIGLVIDNGRLTFTCTNTLLPPESRNTAGGLGNTLIRRRLELLYPNAHVLTITTEDQLYCVKLELSL